MKREERNASIHRRQRCFRVEEIDVGISRPSRIVYSRMSRANRQRIAIICLALLHQIHVVDLGFANPGGDAVIWGNARCTNVKPHRSHNSAESVTK